jgi:hypothetical protein
MSLYNLWLQDVKTDASVVYIMPPEWYPRSTKQDAIGQYSAKSVYLAQFKGSYYCNFDAVNIWKADAEGKHKFFTWLFIQRKADQLAIRN